MQVPKIQGTIKRRILVNYQVELQALAPLVPAPFRPKAVAGVGIAGICLMGLRNMRPGFVPAEAGVASENAAHRVAVEWIENGALRQGVYVIRRDSSSRFNELVGGRLFPGIHHHARFEALESGDKYRVAFESDDGQSRARIEGRLAAQLPSTSVFTSLSDASQFFEAGSTGYSP